MPQLKSWGEVLLPIQVIFVLDRRNLTPVKQPLACYLSPVSHFHLLRRSLVICVINSLLTLLSICGASATCLKTAREKVVSFLRVINWCHFLQLALSAGYTSNLDSCRKHTGMWAFQNLKIFLLHINFIKNFCVKLLHKKKQVKTDSQIEQLFVSFERYKNKKENFFAVRLF